MKKKGPNSKLVNKTKFPKRKSFAPHFEKLSDMEDLLFDHNVSYEGHHMITCIKRIRERHAIGLQEAKEIYIEVQSYVGMFLEIDE